MLVSVKDVELPYKTRKGMVLLNYTRHQLGILLLQDGHVVSHSLDKDPAMKVKVILELLNKEIKKIDRTLLNSTLDTYFIFIKFETIS